MRVLTRAASEFADTGRGLPQLLDAAAQNFGELFSGLCVVRLWSSGSERLERGGGIHHGDPAIGALAQELLLQIPTHPTPLGLLQQVFQRTHGVCIAQLGSRERASLGDLRYAALLEQLGVQSALVVPLRCAGQALGFVLLLRDRTQPAYSEEQCHLAEAFAAYAALAINNHRSFAAAQRMAARLRLLSELTREFARSTGDYHGLIQLIARRLGETLGEACLIRMVPEHSEYFEAVEGLYHPDAELMVEWRV